MDKINLTENEKRDIIKYLESGRLLLEKSRFLLFADKKEIITANRSLIKLMERKVEKVIEGI